MGRKPLTGADSARRFWQKVDRTGDHCWPWTGVRYNTGYGQVKRGGRTQTTHRLAWTLTYGAIPDGLIVCHHCDNPICCRPDHLFLGTHHTNALDRTAKQRGVQAVRYGAENGMAILTEADVRAIREGRAEGRSYNDLAREFGTSKSNVANIAKRRTWTHVP